MIKTVILGGTEQEIRFDGNNTYYWVQNLSDADVLASLESGIVDGADGVLTIPSGGAGYVRDDTGAKKLYIIGTGKVQIYGTNNAFCPFKIALGGGESSSGESIIAWLPVVSPEGTISWYRSSSTIAPATQNIKGENGTTYVPSIGTVTTVDSTAEASVSVELDENNKKAVFNFSIPKGEKGDTDADGSGSSFTLEPATSTVLGGVLSGGDISVNESGAVTVNSVNGKTVGTDVPENAVFTDTVYTLPTASESELGGVKVDGTTVTIDENGVISAEGDYVPVSGGTMEGTLVAQSNTDYTVAQVRNVIISSEAPSGTAPEGTIWYQYEVTG